MIKKFVKKLVGIKSKDEESKLSIKVREKMNNLQNFFEDKSSFLNQEYLIIKKKLENLRETNYNQGLKYLERGDLKDAIWRFSIVKKFWPDLLDAHYQLAYSLMLNKKPHKAEMVLRELLQSHPDYDPKARELLARIENISSNAS
ncbi:MAG: hypothetical protein KGP29_05955 [Proteobacteria bacterium]|nr:hypothetical protein [Pseudomonadota bacterium]